MPLPPSSASADGLSRVLLCHNSEHRIRPALAQCPTFAVIAADQRLGLRCVGGIQLGRVPLELFADAVSHVPEVVCLGQPTRILEVAGRGSAGFASVDPLSIMAE